MEFGQPLRYEEDIDAPLWLMAILATSLAVLLAASVTVALDPDAGWRLFIWYYPLIALIAGLLVAVIISFRRLRTEVSESAVLMSFGFVHKTLPLSNIQKCETRRYRWLTYGGWGIRYASGGRRAWSMLGVSDGVEMTVTEGRRVRSYFVSSRSPELLAAAAGGR
jgi:hypothetical protein